MMNKIIIESRRKKLENIQKTYPHARIIDVTSKAEQPWVRFSPFYPIGNIPVPFSENICSQSVEGVWQGLKVFASCDIDMSKFNVSNMKGLKRTIRTNGKILGHRAGIKGSIIGYLEARKTIYIPTYQYVLNHFLLAELEHLRQLLCESDVVLLDYETNQRIDDISKPLSHASLIANHIIKNVKFITLEQKKESIIKSLNQMNEWLVGEINNRLTDCYSWVTLRKWDDVYLLNVISVKKVDVDDELDLLYSDATEFLEERYMNANDAINALAQYIDIFNFDVRESYERFPFG